MSTNFKYALNASTIRPAPLLTKIEAASRAGYAGIELWHSEIDAFVESGGTLATIREALEAGGLDVPTTIYLGDWFDCPEAHWPVVRSECLRRLDQAAALGASYTIAGPPAGAADIQVGSARYRALIESGLERGVRVSMEFLGFVEQINTIESALEIMQLSGHPAATVVLDPFHIFRGGGSMEAITRLEVGQIAISHFNDTPDQPPRLEQHDHSRVLPGEGHLDSRRYIQLLRERGYTGWLSLELFNEELWTRDPFEVARIGLERMRAVAE